MPNKPKQTQDKEMNRQPNQAGNNAGTKEDMTRERKDAGKTGTQPNRPAR